MVAPSLTKSCSHAVVDEATIALIHQRQQELLRSSLQDRTMDVQNNDVQPVSIEHLLQSPLFTMSSFGTGATNQNCSMNHIGSMTMNELRGVAGGGSTTDSMMYVDTIDNNYIDETFNNTYHYPASVNSIERTMEDFTTLSYRSTADIDEQQRFDSIRTMDMVDLILNRPIDDTLRSEELNFLLNDSIMDEAF